MKTKFSREELHSLFDYMNGVLLWKASSKKHDAGSAVRAVGKGGYLYFTHEGRKMQVHHAIAEMFLDKPEIYDCIDHINRDKTDNRKENLRYTSSKMNSQNSLISDKRNKSGVRGVHKKNRCGTTRYYARIFVDGKHVSLGSFSDEHDAGKAYLEAKKRLHQGFNWQSL